MAYVSPRSQHNRTLGGLALVTAALAVTTVVGTKVLNKVSGSYEERVIEEVKLDVLIKNAPRIGVYIGQATYDEQGNEHIVRFTENDTIRELKAAGIKLDIIGKEYAVEKLHDVIYSENGKRPYEENGLYFLPSLNRDDRYGNIIERFPRVSK